MIKFFKIKALSDNFDFDIKKLASNNSLTSLEAVRIYNYP
jgi:hypothetical protein